MNQSTYASRFRYLDADDVDDAEVDYDGLDVYGPDGQKVGDVDGFIIDAEARRVNYVVIDSGGWFTSRRLLLPVGHVTLGPDRKSLRVDVTRDALGRLPEYHPERFGEFSDEELRAFERNTVVACCPDEPLEDVTVTSWGYDSRRHYTQPEWRSSMQYAPERLRSLDYVRAEPPRQAAAVTGGAAVRESHDRELVTAREHTASVRGDADPSPHLDGRAQPGDVLGIETAGERTSIGDTAEDENKRRQDAEGAVTDDRPQRR